MMPLLRNSTGGLRVTLVTVMVFLGILAGLALIHRAVSKDQPIKLTVAHTLEPEEPQADPPPPVEDDPQAQKDAQAPPEPTMDAAPPDPPKKDQGDKPDPGSEPDSSTPPEPKGSPDGGAPQDPPAEPGPKADPDPHMGPESESQAAPEEPPAPPAESASQETAPGINLRLAADKVVLESDAYFKAMAAWQALGRESGEESRRVGISLHNLETVYPLFQMKVVAVKDGVPHTDLGDNSRVALPALEEFSSTCFLVSSPWEKWGQALSRAGFQRQDWIQVRYYTYDLIRNAIYGRAFQAFEWGRDQLGLPAETPAGAALVTGRVYALDREGGGRFGVFVPLRVAFAQGKSIAVDPGQCFKGQTDVAALIQAKCL